MVEGGRRGEAVRKTVRKTIGKTGLESFLSQLLSVEQVLTGRGRLAGDGGGVATGWGRLS
jgi:hypothetical protein